MSDPVLRTTSPRGRDTVRGVEPHIQVLRSTLPDGMEVVLALDVEWACAAIRVGNDPKLTVATGGRIATVERARVVAACCEAVTP
jgi:hypothetical protein